MHLQIQNVSLILKPWGKKTLAFFQGFSIDHENRICSQNSHGKMYSKERTLTREVWRAGF